MVLKEVFTVAVETGTIMHSEKNFKISILFTSFINIWQGIFFYVFFNQTFCIIRKWTDSGKANTMQIIYLLYNVCLFCLIANHDAQNDPMASL